MAYIGRDISNLSDRAVLDNITASATATYNLLLNSVAYVPSSAESLTVSLNGIIQKPQSSYTVSGSTIVFASALTSSDSIDFILAERAITLTTVGSGSVGTSQLVDSAVTNAKITDGTIANAKLANSSITLNGSAVSLGGSATISSGAGSIEAWVNFNGTGTVAIRDSGNVSSITDNATGDYTINFTNAISNANYAIVVGQAGVSASNGIVFYPVTTYSGVAYDSGFQSTGSFRGICVDRAGISKDNAMISIGVLS